MARWSNEPMDFGTWSEFMAKSHHRSIQDKHADTLKKEFAADKSVKKTGTFQGKSNALGHGGRAAQLKAKGVPGGVIGELARRAGAAPGGPNYHGKRGK